MNPDSITETARREGQHHNLISWQILQMVLNLHMAANDVLLQTAERVYRVFLQPSQIPLQQNAENPREPTYSMEFELCHQPGITLRFTRYPGGMPSRGANPAMANPHIKFAVDGVVHYSDGLPIIETHRDDHGNIKGVTIITDHHPPDTKQRLKLPSSIIMVADLYTLVQNPAIVAVATVMNSIFQGDSTIPDLDVTNNSFTANPLKLLTLQVQELICRCSEVLKVDSNYPQTEIAGLTSEIVKASELLLAHINLFGHSNLPYSINDFLAIRELLISDTNELENEAAPKVIEIIYDIEDPDSLGSVAMAVIGLLTTLNIDIQKIYDTEQVNLEKNLFWLISQELKKGINKSSNEVHEGGEILTSGMLFAFLSKADFFTKIQGLLDAISDRDKTCGMVGTTKIEEEIARELIYKISLRARIIPSKENLESFIVGNLLELIKVFCSYARGSVMTDYDSYISEGNNSTIDPAPPVFLHKAQTGIVYVDGQLSPVNWREFVNQKMPGVILAVILNNGLEGEFNFTFLVTNLGQNEVIFGALVNRLFSRICNFFETLVNSFDSHLTDSNFNLESFLETKNLIVFRAAGITGGTKNNPTNLQYKTWFNFFTGFLIDSLNEFLKNQEVVGILNSLRSDVGEGAAKVETQLFEMFLSDGNRAQGILSHVYNSALEQTTQNS